MRKIYPKRKRWLDNFNSRWSVSFRRLSELKRSGRQKKHNTIVSLYRDGEVHEAYLIGPKKTVPTQLSLQNDCWEDTVQFLRSLRSGLSKRVAIPRSRFSRNRPVLSSYWDFSTIEKMSAPAAMLIASEYDRIRELRRFIPKAVDIHKWKPDVVELLNAIGFFELAGVERQATPTIPIQGGTLLKMQRGVRADGEQIGKYFQQLGLDLTIEDPQINDAIMEAITNCVQHAYRHRELCIDEIPRDGLWWIVAWLSKNNDGRRLRIIVSDHGASIPRTLPMWDKYPFIVEAWKRIRSGLTGEPDPNDSSYDGDAIRLAIEVGRSSTGDSFRGKGLDQIVRVLDLCKNGTVTIYSRAGAVRHTAGASTQTFNHKCAIIGTVVVWDLVI